MLVPMPWLRACCCFEVGVLPTICFGAREGNRLRMHGAEFRRFLGRAQIDRGVVARQTPGVQAVALTSKQSPDDTEKSVGTYNRNNDNLFFLEGRVATLWDSRLAVERKGETDNGPVVRPIVPRVLKFQTGTVCLAAPPPRQACWWKRCWRS